MCLTAFFGMMQVGEITCSNSTRHNLLVSQVSANQNFYSLNLNSYKHSPGDNNKILLQKQADIWLCPVSALNQYFGVRPKEGGPLFVFSNGKPVTRSWFTKQLEYSLIAYSHLTELLEICLAMASERHFFKIVCNGY